MCTLHSTLANLSQPCNLQRICLKINFYSSCKSSFRVICSAHNWFIYLTHLLATVTHTVCAYSAWAKRLYNWRTGSIWNCNPFSKLHQNMNITYCCGPLHHGEHSAHFGLFSIGEFGKKKVEENTASRNLQTAVVFWSVKICPGSFSPLPFPRPIDLTATGASIAGVQLWTNLNRLKWLNKICLFIFTRNFIGWIWSSLGHLVSTRSFIGYRCLLEHNECKEVLVDADAPLHAPLRPATFCSFQLCRSKQNKFRSDTDFSTANFKVFRIQLCFLGLEITNKKLPKIIRKWFQLIRIHT